MLLASALVVPLSEANEPLFGDMNSETKALDHARKILSTYGRGGTLCIDGPDPDLGLTAYINHQEFKTIFKDAGGQLSFDEWYGGFLFCESIRGTTKTFECKIDDPQTSVDKFKSDFKNAPEDGKLTEKLLYRNNHFWKAYVDSKAQTHWQYVSSDLNTRWTESEVAVYLKKVEEIRTSRISVDDRMDKLTKFLESNEATTDKVKEEVLEEFFRQEIFESADSDHSDFLDIYEAKRAFPVENFLLSFIDASGADLRISRSDYDDIASGKINAYIFTKVIVALKDMTPHRRIGEQPKPIALSDIKRDYESQYTNKSKHLEAQIIEDDKQAVSGGVGWIPDRGLLIFGEKKYDRVGKKVVLDGNEPALLMRVIEDFTKDDGKASLATFSLSKTKGEGREYAADVALRFNYYNPRLYDFSKGYSVVPGFGLQWNRSGSGDKRQDIRKAFLLADWYWGHGGSFWSASELQIGPIFERDEVKNIDKLTGLIQLEPLLRIGSFTTGVRMPILGKNTSTASIYFRPRVALELGEILDKPAGVEKPDANFLRAELDVGLRMFRKSELTYKPRYYKGLDGSRQSHFYNEVTLSWYFDKQERYSINAKYKKGEVSPTFTDIDQYNVGLGLKF